MGLIRFVRGCTGCCRIICILTRTSRLIGRGSGLRAFDADSVHEDMTRGWKDFDRSVGPVEAWTGGTHAGLKRLKLFVEQDAEGL